MVATDNFTFIFKGFKGHFFLAEFKDFKEILELYSSLNNKLFEKNVSTHTDNICNGCKKKPNSAYSIG